MTPGISRSTAASARRPDVDDVVVAIAHRAAPGSYRVLTFVRDQQAPDTAAAKGLRGAHFQVSRFIGEISQACTPAAYQACNLWHVLLVEGDGPPDAASVATAKKLASVGYAVIAKWTAAHDAETSAAATGAVLSQRTHETRTTYYATWPANPKGPSTTLR